MLCFSSFLFKHLFERVASMTDVLSKQIAGGDDVALTTQLENLVMLFVRPFHAVRQVKLQAGIALSLIHI